MKTRPLKIKVYRGKPNKELDVTNRNLHPNLPKMHFLASINAMRGSGKTNLLMNFIGEFYNQKFDNIYLVCPTFHNEANNKWAEFAIDESKVISEFNDKEFPEFVAGIDNTELNLIIFDDCGNINANSKNLTNFLIKHRHYNCSVILSLQFFKMISRTTRANLTDLIVFKMNNSAEVKDLADELGIDLKRFKSLLPKEMYRFIHFDLRNNIIRRDFDETIGAKDVPSLGPSL